MKIVGSCTVFILPINYASSLSLSLSPGENCTQNSDGPLFFASGDLQGLDSGVVLLKQWGGPPKAGAMSCRGVGGGVGGA